MTTVFVSAGLLFFRVQLHVVVSGWQREGPMSHTVTDLETFQGKINWRRYKNKSSSAILWSKHEVHQVNWDFYELDTSRWTCCCCCCCFMYYFTLLVGHKPGDK